MVGTPQVNLKDAVGVPPVSSEDIPSRAAVIGAAHQGTFESRYRAQTGAILGEYIAGPLVRSSRHILSNTRIPLITTRCEASNPGSYGPVDDAAVTGDAVFAADATVVPRDEFDGYWRIIDGGQVTIPGVTYYESNDGGRTLSGLKKLGTATSFQFPADGIKVDLLPPEAVAVAYLNDLVTKFQAHVVEVTDLVHGAADPAAPYTIGTASDWASGYSTFGQLKTAALAHVATVGATHGAADNTAAALITAIGIPAAPRALVSALLAFKAAFFGTPPVDGSGHTQRTQGTMHGAQDAINLVTAPAASQGTLNPGDVIRVRTVAPSPSVDDLAAAFSKLALSNETPGFVVLPGRTPASYAPTISAGLDLMKAKGKPCGCIVQARAAAVDESQQELRDALENEWSTIDKRILVAATDALEFLTEGSATLAVVKRRFGGYASNFAVRRIVNPFYETTWKVQPPLQGVSLVDENGDMVGHDEPTDVPTRLQLLYRVPDSQLGRPTVPSIDYTLAGDEDREKTLRVILIKDEIERVHRSWSWGQVGTLTDVRVTGPTTGVLNEGARQDLQRNAAANLASRAGLAAAVVDIEAPDLVTVEPNVTRNGDIVFITAVIRWTPRGAIGRIDTTLSTRLGNETT